jgi:hypothetical protein
MTAMSGGAGVEQRLGDDEDRDNEYEVGEPALQVLRGQVGAEPAGAERADDRGGGEGQGEPAESDRSGATTPGADASCQPSNVPVRAVPAGMDDGASRLMPAPASMTSRLCRRTLGTVRRLGRMRATYRVNLRRGTGPGAVSPEYCRGAIAIVRADRGRER